MSAMQNNTDIWQILLLSPLLPVIIPHPPQPLTWTGVGRGARGQVFPSHPLQHPHEGRDQSVDVTRIVQTRRLQDHQRTKQLRGGGPTASPVQRQMHLVSGPVVECILQIQLHVTIFFIIIIIIFLLL